MTSAPLATAQSIPSIIVLFDPDPDEFNTLTPIKSAPGATPSGLS